MKKQFNFDEFLDFVREENKLVCARCKDQGIVNETMQILAHTVKLAEELGEFSSEILINQKLVRKEKLYDNMAELRKEFADVVIVALELADLLNIDIKQALLEKSEIIKARRTTA